MMKYLAALAILFAVVSAAVANDLWLATGSGISNDVLMESSFYVLQEDGTSKLILEP